MLLAQILLVYFLNPKAISPLNVNFVNDSFLQRRTYAATREVLLILRRIPNHPRRFVILAVAVITVLAKIITKGISKKYVVTFPFIKQCMGGNGFLRHYAATPLFLHEICLTIRLTVQEGAEW